MQEEVAAERVRLGRLSHALDPDAPRLIIEGSAVVRKTESRGDI